VVRREVSALSAMPEGLLDTLSRAEIAELLAYLESAGDPQSPVYQRRR
jgi:mono/diheme cytochrome c family protein